MAYARVWRFTFFLVQERCNPLYSQGRIYSYGEEGICMQLVEPSKFASVTIFSIGGTGARACELGLCCNTDKRRWLYSKYGRGMPCLLRKSIYALGTAVFRLVVQKSRRESTHAQNFQPTKSTCMRGFSLEWSEETEDGFSLTYPYFKITANKSSRGVRAPNLPLDPPIPELQL